MARGRHRRRSGLLSRLLPWRRLSRVDRLHAETARLRLLTEVAAATAGAALERAAAAQEATLEAELRALRAETALSSARDEMAALRADLAALREELVWAFAARRADVEPPAAVPTTVPTAVPTVIDLREGTASSA